MGNWAASTGDNCRLSIERERDRPAWGEITPMDGQGSTRHNTPVQVEHRGELAVCEGRKQCVPEPWEKQDNCNEHRDNNGTSDSRRQARRTAAALRLL